MPKVNKKIGFIGAGNMGEAFIGAIIKSGLLPADRLYAADVDEKRLDMLCNAYGIRALPENTALFSACDIVVLAVKPQQMAPVLSGIAQNENYRVPTRKLIISIAAGITLNRIESILYAPLDEASIERLPIIRVMPNTPALVLEAVAGMSPNRCVTPDDLALARKLLEAIGTVVDFEEADLNAVTGLSGSGPAYVFFLAESMIEAGIEVGLKPAEAAVLTRCTLKGAVRLLETAQESPEQLRRKVTSPGGTTAAALDVFEKRAFKSIIRDAIAAATRRAGELSH
jgi:pyrroline-5-carboxylate reductase